MKTCDLFVTVVPPVVEALMDRGIAVFAINPKQLDRFRDRFSPAGAKDDRRDALVLASSLRTDRHCFRRVEALDPVVVELREWSRMAEELKQERNRLTNRVRQQFWRYYPQFLALAEREKTGQRARRPSHSSHHRGWRVGHPQTTGADRGAGYRRSSAGAYRHHR